MRVYQESLRELKRKEKEEEAKKEVNFYEYL